MLILSLLCAGALAVPVEMNHQGRLLDSDGAGLEGSYLLTFRLYDAETGGSQLWTTAMAVDFDNGYYSAQLGTDGSLDQDALSQYPTYLELQLDSNDPMEPRYSLSSVPYAIIAESAESLFGGPVDATELYVNGTQVVDADGNWVGGGSTGSGGTGSSGSLYWSDLLGVPSDLLDGDDDTQLTESDVEAFILNGTINLVTGSRMGGYDLLTTDSTLDPFWSDIQGVPSDLLDGDSDVIGSLSCNAAEVPSWSGSNWLCTEIAVAAQLSESDVEGYIENGPVALATGSTVGGDAILTAGDLQDPDWGDIQGVPAGFADGTDDDTLADLGCQDGETISWDGSVWECASISFSDSDSLGALSCAEGQIAVLSAGVWACGNVSDADSLAALGCGEGEVALYTGGSWTCAALSDSDSLGVLGCADGEVAVYSSSDGGWICGEAGASGQLATDNVIGESDGGFDYDSLDTPAVIPDNNNYGFVSARAVGDAITVTTFSMDLAIDHPDMGEITVVLTSPEGTSVTIYDGDHPGQSGFDGNIGWDHEISGGDLYSYYGESPVGVWTLTVTDSFGADTGGGSSSSGTLEGWTLRLNEDWNGGIFVGDNVTVQETIEVRGELQVSYGGSLVFTDTDGNETVRIDGETGSVQGLPKPAYRWARWGTYAHGYWQMGNNADLFGGIAPSNWTNSYSAYQMSDDKGILSVLFSERGYSTSNGDAKIVAESDTSSHYCSNGQFAAVLFRIKNTTESDYVWEPSWYFTSYGGCSDYASVALNGQHVWDSGGSNYTPGSNRTESLTIPAGRTSTAIFVSAGYNNEHYILDLAFYNGSLLLPEGLEFVDDLDEAENGWDY
jgi:subtilisin-like proprotein convertase family protein